MEFKYLILLSVLAAVNADPKTFVGYKVFKVTPKTDGQLELLKDLQRQRIAELWEDAYVPNRDYRLTVAPDNVDTFVRNIESAGIESKEVISDMQKAIDNQLNLASNGDMRNSTFLSFNWERYHDLDEIYDWLDELQENYPDVVTTVTMGQSVEGRDIKGVVIDFNPNRERNLIGMIEGTIHAREWITPALVTWVIKEFLISTDPDVRSLAESLQWHMFPVVNPDGYVYTFTTNRMWRKNRSRNSATSCADTGVDDDMSNGVDLNRNFDFVWMSAGASDNPCSNTYAGPEAASEPETQAITRYVTRLDNQGDIIYYLGIHSYSQLILIPYSHVSGFDVLQAKNYADMYEIAVRSADSLEKRSGTTYQVGVSSDVMYPMSGASFDWVKYEIDVPVSLLIELRDLGEYGFLLPPEQIIPNNLEMMDALVEMDKTTKLLGYYTADADGSGTTSVICSSVVVAIGVLVVMFH